MPCENICFVLIITKSYRGSSVVSRGASYVHNFHCFRSNLGMVEKLQIANLDSSYIVARLILAHPVLFLTSVFFGLQM